MSNIHLKDFVLSSKCFLSSCGGVYLYMCVYMVVGEIYIFYMYCEIIGAKMQL